MSRTVSIYSPIFSGDRDRHGGITPVIRNLARGLSRQGIRINLLTRAPTAAGTGRSMEDEGNISIIPIDARNRLRATRSLLAHVQTTKPDALLSAGHSFNCAAARLKSLAPELRVILSVHNNLSLASARMNAVRAFMRKRQVRRAYPKADAIICVSRGVQADLLAFAGMTPEKTHVIYNPIVDGCGLPNASDTAEHPWLSAGPVPVILGIGRLERQKAFDTLIRAFAIARKTLDCRLIIIGEGGLRHELEGLVRSLGLESQVSLPGFSRNPAGYIRHAAVVALSSDFEGFGNVLVEAMAMGTPVVATDCPSGPREILEDGRYGILVPVQDPGALAEGILNTLKAPTDIERLREGAERFTIDSIAERYLEVLLPGRRC